MSDNISLDGYNTRILTFPDGTVRYHHSTKIYHRKTVEQREEDKKLREELEAYKQRLEKFNWVKFAELYGKPYDWQGRPLFDGMPIYYEDPVEAPNSNRKKVDNMKRARQKVYDIARSNPFTHFITLTFDPEKVDSFDYSIAVDKLESFTKLLRRNNCTYILVPELHDSGRYHFHGLITLGDLRLEQAVNPYTGALMYDKQGRPVYNLPQYDLGFSTATEITDPARTASYIAKYLTKEMQVPKGKKCYWASRSCARPTESLAMFDSVELTEHISDSRYVKVTNNEWGDFLIAETERGF